MESRVIVHVDMDAFFAAVEQRDNPRLKGLPVVIGADPKKGTGRGVVSTCSYEARKFGIHSAQPISIAYKKCPQAVFLSGNFQKYRDASREIRSIFYNFTPDVEPISIDEAFLDITGSYHFYKTPLKTCQVLKDQIKQKVGLNASVGIAPVKFVAKIASDFCKPDGLLEITEGDMLPFLWKLPIGRLWGVGPKSQEALHSKGIRTVKELAQVPYEKLYDTFGEYGNHLYNLAHGIDPREVAIDDEIKSVSHEHTFNEDTSNREEIESILLHLCEKISRRLRKYELMGKTITVKIRLKGFKTYTRAHTIGERTNFVDDIYNESARIFNDFYKRGMQIRLIGAKISNFEDPYVQDSLFFSDQKDKRERIHKAVDTIKDKFGEESIHRGSL